MNSFISVPALVVGFREGLEGFLIVAIALRFFTQTGQSKGIRGVWIGAFAGIGFSFLFGGALYLLSNKLGNVGRTAKLWESGTSFFAVILVTTFIVWMIKHGSHITSAVENNLKNTKGTLGIALIVFVMILREGVEISLFAFAGTYPLGSIFLGLAGSLVLVGLVFTALIRVNLAIIFNITLGYLILQAGFLLGYGIHEGLSAAKEMGILAASNPIFIKAFDLSATILDHKTGAVGILSYALFGWYSRPEWVQFGAQYLYTVMVFAYWLAKAKKNTIDRV